MAMRELIAFSIVRLICGCETTRAHRTFVFASDEFEETFQQYHDSAPPESREKIDALKRDARVRIHLIRGQLDSDLSRGGASAPHDSPLGRQFCIMHPAQEDGSIENDFDWDIVIDDQLRLRTVERIHLETPIGALLEHEILGHFLQCYAHRLCRPPGRDRIRWQAERENEAILQENNYRAYQHLHLVNWTVSPEGRQIKRIQPRVP